MHLRRKRPSGHQITVVMASQELLQLTFQNRFYSILAESTENELNVALGVVKHLVGNSCSSVISRPGTGNSHFPVAKTTGGEGTSLQRSHAFSDCAETKQNTWGALSNRGNCLEPGSPYQGCSEDPGKQKIGRDTCSTKGNQTGLVFAFWST